MRFFSARLSRESLHSIALERVTLAVGDEIRCVSCGGRRLVYVEDADETRYNFHLRLIFTCLNVVGYFYAGRIGEPFVLDEDWSGGRHI